MLFSIEGNIGSGKSTLVNLLKKEFTEISNIPVHFVDEPVSQWEMIQSDSGKHMIELFYSDPTKYAFAFQMMAYISRLSLLHEAMLRYPNDIIITERCLLTDYHVFAKMLYENKSMLKEEYEIYQKWFHYFQQEIVLSGIIYIKTDPEVAHTRCLKRARQGETITLEYLEKCHQKHEDWISQEQYDTLIIDNNELDPDYAIWMIHDFIADHIFEQKEPGHPVGIVGVLSTAFAVYGLCMLIVFYHLAENIQMTRDTLNYQKTC
jgi:deoxyadenosine/deoxycytidine kinase